MLFESAPGIGKVEHWLASSPPEDGSAEKDGHAQRGRLPVWGARLKCLLVKAQEVEGEEHGEKGGFGRVEVLHAKPIDVEFGFELFNALFDDGALVIIAPEREGVLAPIGHKDAKGVAGHIDELAA